MKGKTKSIQDKKIQLLYNQTSPQYAMEISSLAPMAGTLDTKKAHHLLSRCVAGFTNQDLETITNMPASDAVDLILEDRELPQPPVGIDSRDEATPVGETWVDKPYNSDYTSYRKKSLHAWWMGQILASDLSIREKLVLFWHNHFAVNAAHVNRADFLYQYNDCLRKNSLGNFKLFLEEITVSPVMLHYLDGKYNTASSLNENYARALLELFTLGLESETEEGYNKNFTAEDVVEAAKVLSGWQIDADGTSYFNAEVHDESEKIFSEAFGNATISNDGENEYKVLIQLLLSREETARNIVRKLYQWFVYYAIDSEIETNIIQPLASLFISSNYEIKPVVSTLLKSQHFFNENLNGCLIKNPIDFVSGLVKQCSFPIPGKEMLTTQYELWEYFRAAAANQEMELGYPPNEPGWPAYYQSPQYHQLWINASTLGNRMAFCNNVLSPEGIQQNGTSFKADPIALANTTSDPSDINQLVNELVTLFYPNGVSETKFEELKQVILQGIPEFEWSNEWEQYQSNPSDENQKSAIESKLRALILALVQMPEYYLS